MMRITPSLLFPTLLAFMTLDCGGDVVGDGTFTSSLTGSYGGTAQDNIAGSGTLAGSITQSGSSFSGTFSTAYSNPDFNNSGVITGTVNGNSVSFAIDSADPATCDFVGTGTRSSEDRITGTFQETAGCSVDVAGSLDISR